MKNYIFTFLATIFQVAFIFAQPYLQWESRFNGPIANDQGSVIAVDAGGNVYVTGSSDGITGTSDYLTIKYNAAGDTLWSRRYNGNADGVDEALAIKVDPSGNAYVTGRSQGNGSGYNIVTIKYNSFGVQQWASIFSGQANSINIGYNLAVDVFGNVYVVGGNSVEGSVVVKYNSSGAMQWSQYVTLGTYQNKKFITINNNDGNIIIAGGTSIFSPYYVRALNSATGNVVQSYNTSPINYSWGIPNVLILDGLGNIYVTSESSYSGSSTPRIVYTTKFTYPGTNNQSYAWSQYTYVTATGSTLVGVDMKIDNDVNVYVLAKWYTGSNFYFLVKKLNPSGNQLWAIPTTSAEAIEGTPVSLSLGNSINQPAIYLAGYTFNGDIKTIKLSNDGDTLWTQVYDCGNNGIDIASAMVMDNCDNIYITGSSNCNGTFKDVKTIKYAAAEPPTITGPTSFCLGSSVTLASSQANSYLWSNGATTQSITVSSSGNYSVTVTNAPGCSLSSSVVTVTAHPLPATPTISGPTTFCEGASVTLTSSQAQSYLWSNGATTQSITVSTPGNYSVTVGNAAGCTAASSPVTVSMNPSPPVPAINTNGPTTFCQGGSVTLTSSQAQSYQWSNGATTQSITVSTPGNYSVTVANASGCTAASSPMSVIVNPLPPIPTITPDGLTTFCQGNSVTLTADEAHSYLWSNGATTRSITVSAPGNYSVTVSNATGCTAASFPISVSVNPSPPIPAINADGPTTFCQGGSVILTTDPAHSYLWSNGATTQNITVFSSGNYSVTVANDFGCTAASSNSINVAVNPLPATPTISGPTAFCEGASITLNSSQAQSYLWSNGATTQSIIVSTPGIYSVTVGDAAGCTAASAPVNVSVNPLPPIPNITPDGPTTFCEGNSVELTADEAHSYLWSNGATTQTITVSSTGIYAVTVANAAGCSAASATMNVVVNPTPTVDLGEDKELEPGEQVVLDATGEGLSYEWSTGATTPTITVDSPGIYSVTVENSFGCTATDTIEIIVTSSQDQYLNYTITIYPNPANDIVYIKCEGSPTTSVRLRGNLGNLLLEDNAFVPDGAVRTMHLEKIPAGHYYIEIIGKDFRKAVPFVKIAN
jgi:hypothetical protein